MALPLVYLTVDFVRFPVLLTGCPGPNHEITVHMLLQSEKHVLKGSYLGHKFYVALEDAEDSGYLDFLKGRPTALIIGVDHSDPSQFVLGPLNSAVLGKLKRLSPTDDDVLKKFVFGKDPAPGQLRVQELHIPAQAAESFPVDDLYIIGIKTKGSGDQQAKQEQTGFLHKGLRSALARAKMDHIANLVVPSVGVDPSDSTTLQFRDWFPQLFTAIEAGHIPARIYLSIYQKYGEQHRLSALTSLQDAWDEACAASSKQSVLVREELRLILLAAFICLLVSSLHVAMTLKNFLIIFTAFNALGFGALRSLQPFIEGWDAMHRLLATGLALIFLALAFPYIPKWNPKELFDTAAQNE